MKKPLLYRNNLKNGFLGEKGTQNLDSERMTIAKWQGMSENPNSEAILTWPKTHFSRCFGISMLLSTAPFFLHADDNPANPNRLDYLEATVKDLKKQVAILKEEAKTSGVAPAAGPQLSGGCDAFITGDALCWKANESGLAYVVKAKNSDPTNTNLPGNGDLITPKFSWDAGLRVGLGWRTNHDDWDLYLTWTRFHNAAHSHHQADTRALYPTLADAPFAAATCDRASTHALLHLNVIDIELGREFFVGKSLSLRPHVGFENVWISQHYNTNYEGLPSQPEAFNNIRFRNNFWGFGIRSGLDTQWDLRWGFSLFGDIAFALLYGEYDLKRTSDYNYTYLGDSFTNKTHIDEKPFLARAAMELAIGLKWDCMFMHDRFHFSMQAGWEEHFYFAQNQMFNFFSSPTTGHGQAFTENGDLNLQGITLSLRLDF